jgi:hypothetical protein
VPGVGTVDFLPESARNRLGFEELTGGVEYEALTLLADPAGALVPDGSFKDRTSWRRLSFSLSRASRAVRALSLSLPS